MQQQFSVGQKVKAIKVGCDAFTKGPLKQTIQTFGHIQ